MLYATIDKLMIICSLAMISSLMLKTQLYYKYDNNMYTR